MGAGIFPGAKVRCSTQEPHGEDRRQVALARLWISRGPWAAEVVPVGSTQLSTTLAPRAPAPKPRRSTSLAPSATALGEQEPKAPQSDENNWILWALQPRGV